MNPSLITNREVKKTSRGLKILPDEVDVQCLAATHAKSGLHHQIIAVPGIHVEPGRTDSASDIGEVERQACLLVIVIQDRDLVNDLGLATYICK